MVTQDLLDKVTFSINNNPQDESGTPAERFFGWAPRTYLPNSVKRFIDHQNCKQKQVGIARKKGRSCTNQCDIGNRVLVQDRVSMHWNIHGAVTGKREAGDGTFRSFTIQSDAGRELLHNSCFLKHEWKSPSNM